MHCRRASHSCSWWPTKFTLMLCTPRLRSYSRSCDASGIAWDDKGKRLFVTGKWWHKLYQVSRTLLTLPSQVASEPIQMDLQHPDPAVPECMLSRPHRTSQNSGILIVGVPHVTGQAGAQRRHQRRAGPAGLHPLCALRMTADLRPRRRLGARAAALRQPAGAWQEHSVSPGREAM